MTYSQELIERTIALHKRKYKEEISYEAAVSLLRMLANMVREIAPIKLVATNE